MINKIKEWSGLVALIAIILFLVLGGDGLSFGSTGTRFPNGLSADSTSPVAGEIRGTTSTITATSTWANSPDGFVLWDDFTVATTTSVRAALTNNGTALICDGNSLAVYSDITAFAPSYTYSVGTSTSATVLATNLIASSTTATSTDQVFGIASGWPFLLPGGSSIVLSVGDANSAISSSTYYGNISGQVSIHCWTSGQ